jgi:hypothetical protein
VQAFVSDMLLRPVELGAREPGRLRGVVARRAQGLERSAGAPGAALCLPFADGERSVADLARYFQIDGLGARRARRVASRRRKYFRTNCPSRAVSGPLQTWHAISRSTVSAPA